MQHCLAGFRVRLLLLRDSVCCLASGRSNLEFVGAYGVRLLVPRCLGFGSPVTGWEGSGGAVYGGFGNLT